LKFLDFEQKLTHSIGVRPRYAREYLLVKLPSFLEEKEKKKNSQHLDLVKEMIVDSNSQVSGIVPLALVKGKTTDVVRQPLIHITYAYR